MTKIELDDERLYQSMRRVMQLQPPPVDISPDRRGRRLGSLAIGVLTAVGMAAVITASLLIHNQVTARTQHAVHTAATPMPIGVKKSSPTVPSWMATCLSEASIATAASTGEPSLTSDEVDATARRFNNELPASAPTTTPLYLQFVAPDPGTSEGDALASPVWAVGFSGLHRQMPGGLFTSGNSSSSIFMSGQIVFVSDPGNKWVLALDCPSVPGSSAAVG
jgi:hypothetical protein